MRDRRWRNSGEARAKNRGLTSQTFPIGVASLVTQFEIIWNDMAAAGTIAALVPILLLLFARRYVITALTFGAVREKA